MEPPQSSKIFPANHKTVFLLDHTPYFGISCGVQLEFGYTKGRPGLIPLSPISKSLWTCSVEAAMDYCRIVWDLFPDGKLIRFVISDSSARTLNSWTPDQQNIYQVFGSLSGCGAPPKLNATSSQSEFSVIHGFRTAVEAMCECSEIQHRKRTSLNENAMELQNRCRLICITSARDNESVKNLEDIFQNELIRTNRVATASDHLVAVDHCHLIILNVFPNSGHSSVTGHPSMLRSPILTTEVYSVAAGNQLAPKMTDLLLAHYNLASTTVIGIPMKEEQNASSSANYNVELFHACDAHTALLKSNPNELNQISTPKEGSNYETVTLKWCTPRNNNTADLHNCTTLHRITPAEVNSRPSACLITFLLNGRTVMLETPRKVGSKGMSHMLTSYGGEIFIQTLNLGRSVLEDPPSISEGTGGRVTDYRIADFGLLMRQNRLVPLKRRFLTEKSANKDAELPLEKSKKRLDKFTKYWPLTMSANMIFNYKQLTEPLLSNMLKDELTQEEILQCKQCVYNLISLEAKNEPFPSISAGFHRGKGPRREEQYKALWTELESYVKFHNYSKDHQEIINCLVECRKKPESMIKLEKIEIEQALKGYEHDREQMMQRDTVIRTTFDSPMSPTPSGQTNGTENGKTSIKHKSVYEYFMSKKKKNEKLAGELKATPTPIGYITRLYPQLNDDLPQNVKPVVEQ
ncbi:integrator complex subunit 13 [Planococcus citri]|uniref:integrator complex subunit 13 n=1 Tax=Planococcus citri TaxID=170843 RepID=UPI0031F7926F